MAIGGGGFGAVEWSMLPLVVLGFAAKAYWPRLPNLVMALPAIAVPLTINIIDTESDFSMFLLVLGVVLLASIEDDRRIANGYALLADHLVVTGGILVASTVVWVWRAIRIGRVA